MARKAHAYRRIGEVADWLGVPASTIRYWGTKFKQVKPVQRAGGRRYYRVEDMVLLGGIKRLLHDEGFSIEELRKFMRTADAVAQVAQYSPRLPAGMEHPGQVERAAEIMRFERPPMPTPNLMPPEDAEVVEELRRTAAGGAPGGLHLSEPAGRSDVASEPEAPEDDHGMAEPPKDPIDKASSPDDVEADEPRPDETAAEPTASEPEPLDLAAPLPAAEGRAEDERGAIPPLARHELRAARPAIAEIVTKLEVIRARMGRR